MHVSVFINQYRKSNTFVIDTDDNQVVVVDPGGPDFKLLHQYLATNGKRVSAVLLSHEHADHCLGVQPLYDIASFDLYCSKSCAVNIRNSRHNFSFYSEDIPTFEITLPVIALDDNSKVNIHGLDIEAIETPGHSPGGMCFRIGNTVFTGDTLLNNISPPLTFPHSNKDLYKKSLKKLSYFVRPGMTIYPGHGESYVMEEPVRIG